MIEYAMDSDTIESIGFIPNGYRYIPIAASWSSSGSEGST